MSEYVTVPVECHCDTPHGAEVFLLPRLSFEGGEAATRVLNRFVRDLKGEITEDETADLGVRLGRAYLEHQVVGWTCDSPFSVQELLSDWTMARPIAEKADELYSDAVLSPLAKAAAASSRSGRTARSTSRKSASTGRSRRPSSPSTTPSTPAVPLRGKSSAGDSSTLRKNGLAIL